MERKSAAILTSEFCKLYLSFPDWHPSPPEQCPKQDFLELLLHEKYSVNEESIITTLENLRSHSLRDADIHRIRELCTPQYEVIFHYILGSAQQDLGVAFLVSLRRDVSAVIHYWKYVEKNEVQDSVLQLQRITYEKTPASIIEQIAFKEAVHPLQSLQDLRTRLGPGRRCFAFFHPALPDKPLVFVHVALLEEIPKSMEDLQSASEDSELNATCAAFYSISNSEQGLAGVDLGNHLIKSVVQVLQSDFPALHTFCTLSPIPKFRIWLEGKIVRYHEGLLRKQEQKHGGGNDSSDIVDDGFLTQAEYEQLQGIFSSGSPLLDLLETLKSPTWHAVTHGTSTGDEGSGSVLVNQLQPLLMKLAAYYLAIETHHGRPICPVAKFHIRNGAEMYRLNFMADCSKKGLRNSYGMMINYRYLLDEIEENRVQYEINGDVLVKDGVLCWLNGHVLT
ncbi:hypothetical protein ACHAW5_003000 [Stephanodiscus triporus]|uniref:Malonyl-CoA decarboxylase C-terminal domain-containing protein n=1 Tax=Stephanodiscus triporus TaxID=2934178 RepID=A0ABD3MX12_9STRA